ncbi:hypothetical protein IFM89_032513 [Coptis chinensis]|uniref:Pentatricopeptide repeat-containing protein n=1 Tax=Coptis chinensis TaxID=261450 RepID=A0A835MD23_9MAGN|nr:hypothetical protein IFM89_032513 [Coptis chinensis]
MREKGLSPNDITYSILIDSFCENGKLDVAFYLLDRMIEEGIKLTVYPYNSLICGCSKFGNLSKAETLLDEMVKKRLPPPIVVTYTSLISGYCREGVEVVYDGAGGKLEISVSPNQAH